MNYVGGIICPGMNISAEALYTRAAKLPRVEIESVSPSLGMDTRIKCKLIILWILGQFENIIKHLKEAKLDSEYKVNRGLSKFIGKHSEYVILWMKN